MLAVKRKLNLKTMYVPFMAVCRFFLESIAYLPYFIKIFLFDPDENINSVN